MRTSRRRRAFIVSGVVAARVACAALFVWTFISDLRTWSICLFLLACLTDALDGHLARRLRVSPSLGAYFDPTADLILVLAAFLAFVVKGMYPFWTLLLIGSMFSQFVLTSGLRRPLYDPAGKYYGVFLFVAIGITLAFPRPAVYDAVLVGILGFTTASVVSRCAFLLSRRKKAGPHP